MASVLVRRKNEGLSPCEGEYTWSILKTASLLPFEAAEREREQLSKNSEAWLSKSETRLSTAYTL